MLLSILPSGIHAKSLQESAQSPLRIMVEAEPSMSHSVIEAIRRNVARYDFKLEFVGGPDNQHDVRLIVSAGNTWCPEGISDRVHYVSIVALAPDGRLLFTVTRSGVSAIGSINDTVIGVIRNLYRHATSPRKQPTFDSGASQETVKPIEPKEAAKATVQEPPAEPGIYYKNGTEWLRLMETLANVKLTGVFNVRVFLVYSGASANVQVPEQKPEFYVRGFLVSEQDVQVFQLEKKKDQRQVRARTYRGMKTEYNKNDLHRVMLTRVSNGVYKITPASELPQGEYVLQLYASAVDSRGYEFGVTSLKK
jgi:hypothetical protein